MKSPLPKVLHRVGGRTMVDRVVSMLKKAGSDRIIVVVGFGRDEVMGELEGRHPDVIVAVQEEQLGTGHAAQIALDSVSDSDRSVGIFSGDTPLLTAQTVWKLDREHRVRKAAATLLTAELEDPSGYGRIIRDSEGFVESIVEENDALQEELTIREINAGAYIFNREILSDSLAQLRNDNAQGEYYLTDTIAYLRSRGDRIAAVREPGNAAEVLGVNTVEQLLQAEILLSEREGNV